MKRFLFTVFSCLGVTFFADGQLINRDYTFPNQRNIIYVIDGEVVEKTGDVEGNMDINRNDFSCAMNCGCSSSGIDSGNIRSVYRLSGCSAIALFGLRAGNGAIMISTRKGSESCGATDMACSCPVNSCKRISRRPEFQCAFMK